MGISLDGAPGKMGYNAPVRLINHWSVLDGAAVRMLPVKMTVGNIKQGICRHHRQGTPAVIVIRIAENKLRHTKLIAKIRPHLVEKCPLDICIERCFILKPFRVCPGEVFRIKAADCAADGIFIRFCVAPCRQHRFASGIFIHQPVIPSSVQISGISRVNSAPVTFLSGKSVLKITIAPSLGQAVFVGNLYQRDRRLVSVAQISERIAVMKQLAGILLLEQYQLRIKINLRFSPADRFRLLNPVGRGKCARHMQI